MKNAFHHAVIRFIFFGNYFYGICAVALSIEASLQQLYPLNDWLYYLLVFCATILYYTKAYITEVTVETTNKRTNWYIQFRKWVFISQIMLTVIVATGGGYLAYRYWHHLLQQPLSSWLLIFIFPVTALLYYGFNHHKFGRFSLRNSGWLKPFVIGFAWAGLVTVYPLLFSCMERGVDFQPTLVGAWFFIKNFMFITVLCIMFDIKDYAVDYNRQLKTFVVNAGLRKTIFYIIIPLCVVGLASFILFALALRFHPMKIVINIIPFVTLIWVAWSMHQRKSILYYLFIIDGLMLVKALCGSLAMLLFR
ncbi:hypothetical protein [Paraflavitalea sp. CAU 1676]|uniref:hypothetical protein n=1 Tax=Paraflavitalea sp. CAU 1676 TaxID=3032598 RepID=UPI0023DBDA2C|nr:hypothetical protein [Paraflavitalea sp. CAU 1676]MDF2189427.1 hypothetical protein [Paraflavitalea sp. CAU 1676]